MKRSALSTLLLVGLLPWPSATAQTLYVPSGASGIGSSSTANVGIGTAGPGLKLDVVSSLGTTDGIRFSGVSHAWLWVQTSAASGSTAGVEMVGGAPGANWLLFTNRGDITPNADDFSIYKNVAGTGSAGAKLVIQSTGNVGIGTTAPDALLTLQSSGEAALHINSIANNPVIRLERAGVRKWGILGEYPNYGSFAIYSYDLGSRVMVLNSSGNVGIGIDSPNSRLHVSGGDISVDPGCGLRKAGDNWIVGYQTQWPGVVLGSGSVADKTIINAGGNERMRIETNGNVGIGITDPGVTKLRVVANSGEIFKADDGATAVIRARSDGTVTFEKGNVGIGTTNPTQKLSVNGAVRAKEVIVDTGWSDYVFDPTYRLAPLSEVEQHIKAEKHLPGIPSASQVANEGISLGEMQAKLLAKIEELTLHQIEQEKAIAALRARNDALTAEVSALKKSR